MTPGQEHAAALVIQEMVQAGMASYRIEEVVTNLVVSVGEVPFTETTMWVRRTEATIRTALIDTQIKRAVYAVERRDFTLGIPALDEADRLKAGQRP